MGKLSSEEYWDSLYKPAVLEHKQFSFKEKIKALLTTLFGKNSLRSYSDYLLWEKIYKKYLPKTKGLKFLEIGSAPGENLVRFSQTFGYVPYGIEYSESGAELNREMFRLHNLDPANVIHADFLSEQLHSQYKESFDIVYSRGFIEHFTDVDAVIDKHLNLLAKGGRLVVIIPRIKGVNHALGMFFHKEIISMHNLSIMGKKEFSEIFDRNDLSTLFCDYYGIFTFDLFNTKPASPLRFVLKLCNIMQLVLNLIFHMLFRNKRAESRMFSPYLLYIGIKK